MKRAMKLVCEKAKTRPAKTIATAPVSRNATPRFATQARAVVASKMAVTK
jgi:hypothetical protein